MLTENNISWLLVYRKYIFFAVGKAKIESSIQ